MRSSKTLAIAALLGMMAAPAFAQPAANTAGPNATSTTPTSSATHDDTAKVTADGYLRTSKLVGANVYNSEDTSIGSIDDLLIGTAHGKTTDAVISVGGFLGIGNKLVEVPFSKLKLNKDGHLVLTGATKESLTKLPAYEYSK